MTGNGGTMLSAPAPSPPALSHLERNPDLGAREALRDPDPLDEYEERVSFGGIGGDLGLEYKATGFADQRLLVWGGQGCE